MHCWFCHLDAPLRLFGELQVARYLSELAAHPLKKSVMAPNTGSNFRLLLVMAAIIAFNWLSASVRERAHHRQFSDDKVVDLPLPIP